MTTLVLSPADVRRLLPMGTCIDLMEEALGALARGAAENPLRWGMRLPDSNRLLGMMPGWLRAREGAELLAGGESLGLKVVAVFPDNHGTPYDSHQGVVMLFDPEDGRPQAILDASEVTAIRTAAASGLATRLLAREDAGDLAILGTGVQARTHLEAMAACRELRRVRVYSPTEANRAAFAAREGSRQGPPVEACGSAREAVAGADLICTTTAAREPVLLGEWIAPGAHVNAVGACVPAARELDAAAVARARLFADSRESLESESGDFLLALREGAVGEDHCEGVLGDLITRAVPGRGAPDEVTLFKSLGLAVEDLVAAQYVHARAREQGVGVAVELGGLR